MNLDLKLPSCQLLESEFGIEQSVTFYEGKGGWVFVRLAAGGNTADVSLYGGHVTSLIIDSHEVLWLSPMALYQPGKAIRGGIPVCCPWFGPHPTDSSKPNHGFARNSFWQVANTFADDNVATVQLSLSSHSSNKGDIENELDLYLRITLGPTLKLELCATNQSNSPVSIGGALHSYFCVDDISETSLTGLDGVEFLDQLQNHQRFVQDSSIEFSGEVDRIYVDSVHDVTIESGNRIRVGKSGSLSTVIWNPWIEKAAQTADMPDDAYQSFVCVETANAFEDIRELKSGESHTLMQEIEKIS